MESYLRGRFERLTGDSDKGQASERQMTVEPDPDVLIARAEQEEKRREKHRKMEADREKMRRNIREKYNIKQKDDAGENEGQFMGNPNKSACEQQADDSIIGQLGLTEAVEKAKTTVNEAIDTVKGIFSFGPFSK
ncbi:Complexin [Trichostrongylus colubriformis]|uniref:Complexin n=1 Tax=Trichostrongylus colubriformis TaxID=6319 RepID=A0AAN8IF41_TRICO